MQYSSELQEILAYMLTKGATIEGLAEALATRTMEALEQTSTVAESLETELSKELDNGRIVRYDALAQQQTVSTVYKAVCTADSGC